MKQKHLDLGPNNYRKRNPRTGKWRIGEDPKLARNMMFLAIGILIWIFVIRDTLTSGTLFGGAAMFAFGAGIMLAIWLKDVD